MAEPMAGDSSEEAACFECMICPYHADSVEQLNIHINEVHCQSPRAQRTAPSLPEAVTLSSEAVTSSAAAAAVSDPCSAYECPVCGLVCSDDVTLRHHVDEHFSGDVTAETAAQDGSANWRGSACAPGGMDAPIVVDEDDDCDETMRGESASGSANPPEAQAICPFCGADVPLSSLGDHLTAHEIAKSDTTELQRQQQDMAAKESEEFKKLQKRYGMESTQKGYSKTYEQRLGHDADRQRISGLDYHREKSMLAEGMARGVDDGSTATRDLISAVAGIYRHHKIRSLQSVSLCCNVTHYSADRGDSGWGCGYRNLQMMMSSLMSVPEYRCRIQRLVPNLAAGQVPSVPKLQELIEAAWTSGFDRAGADQLGHKLCKTRKWIGTTEIAAVLRYCGIRMQIIDFHRPSGPNNTHPAMLDWVKSYYSGSASTSSHVPRGGVSSCTSSSAPGESGKAATSSVVTAAAQRNRPASGAAGPPSQASVQVHGEKFPLYFQHQGHSRTIVGYEERKDNNRSLLIFDPSQPPRKMASLLPSKKTVTTTAMAASSSRSGAAGTSLSRGASSAAAGYPNRTTASSAASCHGAEVAADAGRIQVIRRPLGQHQADKYQVAYVDGLVMPAEVNRMKTIRSRRIP
eukprot:scpid49978/ scgid5046/ Zinc finger with UFM1-specific peptidase domain protein